MKTAKEMFDSVMEKKTAREAKAKARRSMIWKAAASVGCLCLICALGIGRWGNSAPTGNTPPQQTPVAAAGYQILLDVNPSIKLEVGEGDKITEVTTLNKDGEAVLGDSALPGMEVAEGVGVLVAEMVEQGYISRSANSVLVTVAGAEREKADTVKAELAEKITDTLSKNNVEGAILMQEISAEEAAKQTAVDGISAGKAQLIAQIIAQNSLHTYEELSPMTIHQLNLLRESYYVNLEDTQVSGTPSLLSYIGEQKAAELALTAAGVNATAETELTYKAGVMVYVVEFETETHEYRYQVNAVTGAILKAEESELGKNDFFQGDTPVATVGENAALAAALQHAGMENAKLIRCKYKTDWVDGKVIYDLYFTDGLTRGDYVINARTGEILKYSKTQEPKDRSVKVSVIGEAQAKAVALAKDGLVDGNISKYEMNLQKDGDAYVYDLMFICNGVKYTARIAAADGTVLNYERIVLSEVGKTPSAEEGKQPAGEYTEPGAAEGSNPSTEEGNRPSAEG